MKNNPVDELVAKMNIANVERGETKEGHAIYPRGSEIGIKGKQSYIRDAFAEFIERNPKFCAILNEFNKHGETGIDVLKQLMENVGQEYSQAAEQGKKPGFTLGEKVENLLGK